MDVQGYCTPAGPLNVKGIDVPLKTQAELWADRPPVPALPGHRFTEPRPPESKPERAVVVVELPPALPRNDDFEPPDPADVRAWARRTGRQVGDRGRLRESLVLEYLAEVG